MKKVYLVGNAHIDPVWLWRRAEGLSEIMSTFRSALDRMNEFPEYIFTCACASYYRWVEEVDESMFEEIRERVAQGRWVIAGGFWVQPDCNIPSGESFARHALYSQRYFIDKFGEAATFGYNVDSFGHNGMLPQLLLKSGMDSYVFMRPGDNEIAPDSPVRGNLFTWESPDGSRVTAARIQLGYGDGHFDAGEYASMESAVAKAIMLRDRAAREGKPYMGFYGVGNHGGGPTIRGIAALSELVGSDSDIAFSSPREFFSDIRDTRLPVAERGFSVAASGLPVEADGLPVVTGDLQHHASGCYSALSAIKAANRRAENELIAAEKYDVMAGMLTGASSHRDEIKAAWEKVMFNQFHDVLAGCCIKSAYTDALNAFCAARDTASGIIEQSAQRMAWRINTTRGLGAAQKNGWVLWEKDGEGAPVVVFNPHSFDIRTAVQINIEVSGITDGEGQPVPCQSVRGQQTNGGDTQNTLFEVFVPAFGYATYYIFKNERFSAGQKSALPAGELSAGDDFLENENLRVRFDMQSGSIVSFYDKKNGRELAGGAMADAIVIDDEDADTWAHNIFTFDKQIGRFECKKIRLLENGPLRAVMQTITSYGTSTLIQEFRLCAGSRELEVYCTLDFHEKHKIAKLSFPVSNACEAVYSMPYGFIKKAADGVEEPSQEWAAAVDLQANGLAVINDSKYSFCAKGNDLRMIIARGAIYADHYGKRDDRVEYQDQGEQCFSYCLKPASRESFPEVVKRAAMLNQPLHVVFDTHHTGPLAPAFEGIHICEDNIICQVLKQAEDGGGIVARLYETAGRATVAKIKLNIGKLDNEIELSFGPQEVKTVYMERSGECREVDFVERDM